MISSIQSYSVLATSEAQTIDENQEPVENLVENGETETRSISISKFLTKGYYLPLLLLLGFRPKIPRTIEILFCIS